MRNFHFLPKVLNYGMNAICLYYILLFLLHFYLVLVYTTTVFLKLNSYIFEGT